MIREALELRRALRAPRRPPEVLERERDAKLRALVAHAYARVPYWRRRFDEAGVAPDDMRTAADLPRLPITTRRDLKGAGAAAIADDAPPLDDRVTIRTSGTSGEPFELVATRREIASRRTTDFRALLGAGVGWRDVIAIVGPEHERRPRLHDRAGIFRTEFIPGALAAAEQIERLARLRPTVLWIYPTVLRAIVHEFGDGFADVCRPGTIITSSEVLDPVLRARAEALFPVPIFDFYGSNEVGRIAQECPAHDGLHVNVDRLIVELVDGEGRPAEGEGEVIVTSLDARAMPFLRYRLGDRTAMLTGSCACGSSFPRIAAPSGRVWDVVRLPSGRQLSPVAFQVVLRNVDGIDQYRIVQQAPDRFDVTIVPGPSFAADALPVLKERLAAVLGEPVAMDLRLSGFMTAEGRKFKVFESRLPSAG